VVVALAVVVGLLGAATLLGFLSRFSWFFELETFLRLQYAVLLAGAALLALVLRAYRLGVIAFVLALANLPALAPTWVADSQPARLGDASLRLVVANVEYSNTDHAALERVVRGERPDVLGITELTPGWLRAIRRELPEYRPIAVHPQTDAYGIGVFARVPASGRIERFPADGPASVVARVPLGGRPVTLVVTHPHTPFGPHAGGLHRRQFQALAAAVPRLGVRLVICGDLNTPPWSWPFRRLQEHGLRNAHDGHPLEGTWPSWFAPLRVPIDNCLVSRGLVVVSSHVGASTGSDHLPLVIELGLAVRPR
jgi:endonuclease/exonuclease/phosphatase (EEP) superfamily protein YafD